MYHVIYELMHNSMENPMEQTALKCIKSYREKTTQTSRDGAMTKCCPAHCMGGGTL